MALEVPIWQQGGTKPLADSVAETLLGRYQRMRETTSWICDPLTIEDCIIQSAMECSPIKWQLAHTTWFFETFVLLAHHQNYREFHPQYAFLFNSYYNSLGDRTPRNIRGLMSRPTMEEVWNYREHVDREMENFLNGAKDNVLSTIYPILDLGINHEQQHQELMVTDVKTVLAMNPLRPVYRARDTSSSQVAPLRWISFEEGLYEFGKSDKSGFFFDNEGPRHRQYLNGFELGNRLVTNGEYKEFIADDGYQKAILWLSDGWAKVLEENWRAPKYWENHDGEWWMMTLQAFRPVEDSEPVTHISHYEADAFATWAGARLPTEFEWELATRNQTIDGNFLEDANFHPIPCVTHVPTVPGRLNQLFGDVWEWTRSAYLPYPGFHAAEGAIGEYNGKFMSNQMVLRGGSCVTPRDHIRATYRNFFPPESRWQFSGIRLARDV